MHPEKSTAPTGPAGRNEAQPWLDFGRWLAGENFPIPADGEPGDFSRARVPLSFGKIVERYFSDLAPGFIATDEASAITMETRHLLHQRFIEVVHLAFGPQDLSEMAARHVPAVCALVREIRTDFGLGAAVWIPERPLRILHLEDSPEDAEMIQGILRQEWPTSEFQRVWTRTDYEAALKQGGFNLILSDHSMPGFDGLAAFALARRHKPEKPFIFLSGTVGEARAIEAIRGGATDYVSKDHPVRLVSAIRDALGWP